ncbi:MAG: hypothetical protein ACJ77K_04180 [Bacteroidia bacterium]
MRFIRILSFILFSVVITAACSCHPKAGHNVYREAKVRPSERQLKADKKHNASADKAYKKQMLKNRKKVLGAKHAPKE